MGVGHVPQDEAGAQGARAQLQGSQHRGTARQQHLARAARTRANQARAQFAEDRVAAWYVRNGYEVIARNWRCQRGELDVVAWRDGVLVVCEVKARRNGAFGDPFESVTPRKMLRLRRATAAFVAAMRASPGGRNIRELRFDVAAMTGIRLDVRENVG